MCTPAPVEATAGRTLSFSLPYSLPSGLETDQGNQPGLSLNLKFTLSARLGGHGALGPAISTLYWALITMPSCYKNTEDSNSGLTSTQQALLPSEPFPSP